MNRCHAPFLSLAQTVLCLACATAPIPREPHPAEKPLTGGTVIQNVRVFDGLGLTSGQTVIIQGERIAVIGPGLSVPSGAEVVDGTGKTLLPGFIDAHAHVWDATSLEQSAVFGTTTVLDMGCGDPKVGAELRRQVSQPASTLADLRFAGYAVTAPGAHCTEYGFPVPTLTRAEEVPAFVEARIGEGADYIKIIYDDVRAFGLTMPTIGKEVLKAAIDAAHARGKLAVVHIGSLQGAREAIELGADGLAHAFVDRAPDPDFGKLLASRRAFVVPTLSVNSSSVGHPMGPSLLADGDLSPLLSSPAAEALKKAFPKFPHAQVDYAHAERTVLLLDQAHVPLLAGSDAPNPGTWYGASLHGELELLVKAGLSPVAALAAATSAPAAAFRLGDRGRIRAGLRADLLLVEGDPSRDIKTSRKIVAVWRAGARVDRQAYLAKLGAARAEAARQAAAPAPPGSESGLVSDFEALTSTALFGSWAISTDAIQGGQSGAELKAVKGGAGASKGSLLVSGEVSAAVSFAWAGVMFSPGERPMAPANLSAKRRLAFWAKGDGGTYQVLAFSAGRGYLPSRQVFTAGPEWKEHSFALGDFDGMDGHDLMGVAFVGGPKPGKFRFQLDDVRFR